MGEYNQFLSDLLNSTQNINNIISNDSSFDVQWEQQILQAVQSIQGAVSQSTAREFRDERRKNYREEASTNQRRSTQYGNVSSSSSFKGNFSFNGIADDFKKGLSKSLMDAFGASEFKKKIGDALGNLAQSAGINIKDLPGKFGELFGKNLMANLSDSKIFGDLFGKLKGGLGGLGDKISDTINQFAGNKPGANPQNKAQSDVQNVVSEIEDTYGKYNEDNLGVLEQICEHTNSIVRYLENLHPDVADKMGKEDAEEAKRRAVEEQTKKAKDQAQSIEPTEGSGDESQPQEMDFDQLRQMGKNQAKQWMKKGLNKAGDWLKNKFAGGGAEAGSSVAEGAGAGAEGIGAGAEGMGAAAAEGGTVAAEGASVAGGAGAGAGAVGAGGAGAGAAAGSGMAGMASTAAAMGPYVLIIAVAVMIIAELVKKAIAPAIEGIKKFADKFGSAWNRAESANKKNLELANERRRKDIEAIIEKPFKILEASAEKIWTTWDETLKTINATQGYSKADLQDLMAKYGQRLQQEGLIKYVNATDIQSSLSKVLEAGLSGQVAEEFAYLATKLNAAIPTEDFFSYASTYASLAANAISQGKAQADAINYASTQLELFASNVLYASRQLAGGFSTGLKDASSLFASATQIARAAKTNDPSLIGGVLASVSAIIGAIAPDLSSSIVDKVVSAAIGGNESSIVALRSLTGLNASNTEFLNMLAKDPQQIFYRMFSGLARMQNMSNDAYMEVAEGLSTVFGIDMKALASVDFGYLADAIAGMQVGYDSIEENMDQLISGQTTTREEQLENQKINQMIIEEGLSYVLDNEIARTVWLNMQEEQRMREMEEAKYAVELQGAALELLQSLVQSVMNILNILNPFSWINKITNVIQTALEGAAQEFDLYQVLQLGKVGMGNRSQLYNLTTRNQNLMLVEGLATMMGGVSMWRLTNGATQLLNNLTNPSVGSGVGGSLFGGGLLGKASQAVTDTLFAYTTPEGLLQTIVGTVLKSTVKSKYNWGMASKSSAQLVSNFAKSAGQILSDDMSSFLGETVSTSKSGNDALRAKVERLISDEAIKKYVDENKGYDHLINDVNKAANGISNFEDTLETLGYDLSDIKKKFEDETTERGVTEEVERRRLEKLAYNAQIDITKYTKEDMGPHIKEKVGMIDSYIKGEAPSLIREIRDIIYGDNKESILYHIYEFMCGTGENSIHGIISSWYEDWKREYITRQGILGPSILTKLNTLKESEDEATKESFATKLAQVLTEFDKDTELTDASVQTNVLLAKILLILEAARNEGGRTGGLSLPDTLAALALGIVRTNPTT